jgi:hypothetical protein
VSILVASERNPQHTIDFLWTLILREVSNKTIHVKFYVFTAVTIKNAVLWDVAPCKLSLQHLLSWFLARGFFYPEDGGDTFLRNVGSHKIYMVPHPRRRHSSELFIIVQALVCQHSKRKL